MTNDEYLEKVLENQDLEENSQQLKDLRARRDEIEGKLRKAFGDSPSIRYGGSKAKGTLNKDTYDLDMTCHFPRDDEDAGGTVKEIFENVAKELEKHYAVERKTSALRVKGLDKVDFYVDVVPGRFIDDNEDDVFLFRSIGEKERLKTNLDVHISHVKDSGVVPSIRLMKLWVFRNAVFLKTFVLELAVIDVLEGSTDGLEDQLRTVLTKFRDDAVGIKVEDPANPTGNDLSEAWNDSTRASVSAVARATLLTVDALGWEAVFGKLPQESDDSTAKKVDKLRVAASTSTTGTRPWRR
jgi:hypothetical protein